MSQKVKRGGKSARKVAAAQGKARQVRAAKQRTGTALDAAMSWLPFSEEQLQRGFLAVILGAAVALAWIVASFAGVPAMASQQLSAVAADAGFEVRRVEVRGVKQLNELKVYERALAERDRAMPLVDVEALRGRLMELSWVADARVSRQMPDTLVIDIVERKAVAVLRKADRLVLIDAEGHELETVSAERAKDKLVIGGSGAGKQVKALAALLDAAPALKPQVREAAWVGNRRWNLTFKTAQVLALPEGEEQSRKALVKFAAMDGSNRLLGGKAIAFDMRASERLYIRMPSRVDQPRTEGAAAPATKVAEAGTPAAAKPTPAKQENN